MHTFIDLFSGIGGFRVGLEKHGLNCVFSSEIDERAAAAYEHNFKDRPAGDITKIPEKDIPRHDILCGGFPCQSFSLSGKRNGLNDERGRLFYEIVRIAKHHKPYVLLLENVKNIVTIDDGGVLMRVKDALDKIGYAVHYEILNASNYGIPQSRERVYFVCIRKDTTLRYVKSKQSKIMRVLKDIMLPESRCKDLIINRDDIVIKKEHKEKVLSPVQVGYVNKGGQGERIYSANGHAITLSANGGGVGARTGLYMTDNGKIRKLHIEEAKAVMGFDKRHFVSDGIQGYRQLGNAVIPTMIKRMYECVGIL